MKIKFDASVDFNGKYQLKDGHQVEVTVKDGDVTLEILPVFTSGYLRVSDPILNESVGYDDGVYTVSTASTQVDEVEDELDEELNEVYSALDEIENEEDLYLNGLDPDTDEEGGNTYVVDFGDEEDDEEEADEIEEDDAYALANEISKYDKDGAITHLITSLLTNTSSESKRLALYISKVMTNLGNSLNDLKSKLKEA